MREGKNREVRNVLQSLGLDVNRLIRVSYGPFQLGDLPPGKVIEVRSRILREQLGAKLIEHSGANFDAPLQVKPAAAKDNGSRKRDPDEKKDSLKRLSTKKPEQAKHSGKNAKSTRGKREGSNANRQR